MLPFRAQKAGRGRFLEALEKQTLTQFKHARVMANQESALVRRANHGDAEATEAVGFGGMIGRSDAMRKVFGEILLLAGLELDVLIVGETGTGKELVARAIHERSQRREGPFMAVNCAVLTRDLVESELFGHEKGAFSGAQSSNPGLFRAAAGGTFLLDEINELAAPLQTKLLRVMQERTVRPVGATREVDTDVRIVAASSADLLAPVAEGRFRADLYYRLDSGRIRLPPLREREGDVRLLAEHFLAESAKEMGKGRVILSEAVAEALAAYDWPGNVRELQHVVKRFVAHADGGALTLADVAREIVIKRAPAPGHGYAAEKAAFEKEYLGKLLLAHHGNIASVAREAQMHPATVYRLVEKLGLRRGKFDSGSD